MKKTILITGAGGQLGQAFGRECARALPDFEWIAADRSILDISDARSVQRFMKRRRIAVCINCAAYTAVDRAESDADAARLTNTLGPARLARACGPDTLFVHFSTDYVYHNRVNRPLVETDPLRPQSVYARTKLAGEKALRAARPDAMILRASWIFAPWGHNFVNTMRRLGAERDALRVVCDQIGAPTYAPDLAASVVGLIARVEAGQLEPARLGGVWNYANEGVCSWYDLACAVMEIYGLKTHITPISTAEYPSPAARPLFSVLDKSKFKTAFGIEIPHWRDALRRCAESHS